MMKILILISFSVIICIANDCKKLHYIHGEPEIINKELEIKTICYKSHVIGYNTNTKMAKWVEYHITPNMLDQLDIALDEYPRKDKRFNYKFDENIDKTLQIKNTDYIGIDEIQKGHLAPYRNVGIEEIDKININRMSNLVPQNAGLNNGCWKYYENEIRRRATKESLTITIGIINDSKEELVGTNAKIIAPSHMFMFIINNDTKEKSIAFFKNIRYTNPNCKSPKINNISEEALESQAGISIYPNIKK